jgi:hypothetical protein
MTVEMKKATREVVITWDTTIVQGDTASIEVEGEDMNMDVANNGENTLSFPITFQAAVNVFVRGSSGGEDTGRIFAG